MKAVTQQSGLLGLLRVRKVRLPLVAQTVSVFGDMALFITLAIWAKELTGSSSAAGVVILALSTGSLTGPVTARWIDAHPPRRWLIAANLAGAAVTPALLLVHSAGGVWIIHAVAFLYGLIGTVVSAALTAYLKETVPPELAVPVNVEIRALTELMRIAAPAAGAGLYALTGMQAVVLMDIVSFTAAAILFSRCATAEPKGTASAPPQGFGEEARALITDRRLRTVVLLVLGAHLVQGFAQTLGFLIADALGRDASLVGVFVTVQASAAFVITRFQRIRALGPLALARTGVLVAAVGYAILLVPSLPTAMAAFVGVGAGLPLILIAFASALQLYGPGESTGRRALAGYSALGLVQVISIGVGAALALFASWQVLVLIMAIALFGLGAAPVRVRSGQHAVRASPAARLTQRAAVEEGTTARSHDPSSS
ncbi:MFS transporter [Streptomyces sp. NPDC059566]|uniref:MFS transporter n=1 Tax=Streptomyces sp. NPDC059566 TaxID=3346866 RepID=UPI0036994906